MTVPGPIPDRQLPERLGRPPDATAWRRFGDLALLAAGALLALAGIVFFFAYNWEALHRFAKIALVGAPLTACAALAARYAEQRAEQRAGQAWLGGSVALVGVLLAVIGQIYQTGADSELLFAGWAMLALPWVLAGRAPWLWLFWLLLLNVALDLFVFGRLGIRAMLIGDDALLWAPLLLNAAALGAWEMLWPRLGWMRAAYAPRAIALLAACCATALGVFWCVFDHRHGEWRAITPSIYLAWLGATLWFYQRQRRDIVPLAAGALSLIVVAAAGLSRWLLDSWRGDMTGRFLVIGLAIAALTALAAVWLRRTMLAWEGEGQDAKPAHAAPARPGAEAPVSRWILALQVIGGWLAAVFLLLFLGLGAASLIRSPGGWIVAGLLMTGGAALPLMRAGNTALRQFLFVVALAGHGALLIGVDGFRHGGAPYFALALYEAALLVWVAWLPHRLAAALIAGGALALALTTAFPEIFSYRAGMACWPAFYWLAAGLLWLRQERWLASRHADAIVAAACALTLLSLGEALFQNAGFLFFDAHAAFRLDAALLTAVNAIFIVALARPLPREARHLAGVALLLAALALTWQAPAAGMGGVALALGFARARVWLMWLGGAALLWGIGRFYHDLQSSLLVKSGLMLLGGALLLAVRALLTREQTR